MDRIRHGVLAWTLLLTTLATFYSGAYLPLLERHDAALERHDALVDRLHRFDRLIAEQSELKARLTGSQQQRASSNDKLIQGSSQSVAAASLQRMVSEATRKHGLDQRSIQPLPIDVSDSFARLEMNVQVQGHYEAIHDVLYEIEFGSPRIFVDELLIQSHTRSAARGGLARNRIGRPGGGNEGEQLSAKLRVSAFMAAQ